MTAKTHLDETGNPCTRHAPISDDTLLAYASVGSRISGFHHDAASKLQSLMMAVDEISELATDDSRSAANAAAAALRDLHQILTVNRALAKAPQRKPLAVRELLARAAERHGVKTTGELPSAQVNVALASIAHALAMLLDITAGPLQQARTVAVATTTQGSRLRLDLTSTGPLGNVAAANEMVLLATFLLEREDGSLTCKPNGFVVELPLVQ